MNSLLKHSWQLVGFEPPIRWRLPSRLQVILQTKEGANPFKHLVFPPFLLLVLIDHLSIFTPQPSPPPPPPRLPLPVWAASRAPRGPAGPPNASAALRGNGAYLVGGGAPGEEGQGGSALRLPVQVSLFV